MKVTANGHEREVPEGLTLRDLLEHLSLRPDAVAVERNGEAVVRSEYGRVAVADGDRLEIVKAVAGG